MLPLAYVQVLLVFFAALLLYAAMHRRQGAKPARGPNPRPSFNPIAKVNVQAVDLSALDELLAASSGSYPDAIPHLTRFPTNESRSAAPIVPSTSSEMQMGESKPISVSGDSGDVWVKREDQGASGLGPGPRIKPSLRKPESKSSRQHKQRIRFSDMEPLCSELQPPQYSPCSVETRLAGSPQVLECNNK